MESPIFSIPVPIDVEPFLQAADTNLKEVKRPPNCFMIFRSEVINNWPSSLGLRPKDITKSSKLLLPTWNALRDSEEGNPWKLFSRRVAEEHKVRFPEYKYKPGAKQEAKDTQKAIKQEGRKVHAASGLKKRNSLSSRVTIPNDIPTCGEGPYIFPSQSELPSQAPVIFNTPCPPTRSEDGALGGEDINGWKPWQQGEDYSNDATDRYEHNEYYREELAETQSSLVSNLPVATREAVDTFLDTEDTTFSNQLDLVNRGDELYHNYTDELLEASAYVYQGTFASSPTAYAPRLYLPDDLEESPPCSAYELSIIKQNNLEQYHFQTGEY